MKLIVLLYGITCYLIGLTVLTYSILFVGNWIVPWSIDNANIEDGLKGYLINGTFLSLFAVQHTIMARQKFKDWLTKYIPIAAEKATFVLTTALILIGMIYNWRTYDTVIWDFSGSSLGMVLTGMSIFGFAMGIYASFQIDHFELFGLKQVIKQFGDKEFADPEFVTPWLYKLVRNPLMTGFLLGFWATPHMSAGHLFFSVMVTGYVLVGIQIEEHDIAARLGDPYKEYKKRTPMLIPFLKRG